MKLLENKIAVVTGGGQGIGREISLAMARAGAHIVLAARTESTLRATQAEIQALGQQALVVPTDLTDVAAIKDLAAATFEHFGRIDILVNNSGIAGPVAPLWEVDPAGWQHTFDVNVNGVFHCCQAFIPKMVEQGSGAVITIGSMTGKRPMLNRTPYTATKMALVGITRTLAWDLADTGVRANVISPGAVAGVRMENSFVDQAKAQGLPVDEIRAQFTNVSPQKILTPPEDVANTAVFLASDLAKSITGEDINVSAGVVMY